MPFTEVGALRETSLKGFINKMAHRSTTVCETVTDQQPWSPSGVHQTETAERCWCLHIREPLI